MLTLQQIVVRSLGDVLAGVLPARPSGGPLDLHRPTLVVGVIQGGTHADHVAGCVVLLDLGDGHAPLGRRPVGNASLEELARLHGHVAAEIFGGQLASLLHPQLPLALVGRQPEQGGSIAAADVHGAQRMPMRLVAHRDDSQRTPFCV